MKSKKIELVVFAYEFPHFKSEYGLKELISNNYKISLVILQQYKNLSVPVSKKKVYVKQNPLGNIKQLCEINNIKYIISDHNSLNTLDILNKIKPTLGIILGARILKKHIIDSFSNGIINLHPGEIPLNRGLDNFKWAIVEKMPMVVTSHFISDKIDLGKIILKSKVAIYKDDTIYDFSTRHFYNEFKVMLDTLNELPNSKDLNEVSGGNYFSALSWEKDKDIENYFNSYKEEFLKK